MKISSLIYELKEVRKSVGDVDVEIYKTEFAKDVLLQIQRISVHTIDTRRFDAIPYVCILETEQ